MQSTAKHNTNKESAQGKGGVERGERKEEAEPNPGTWRETWWASAGTKFHPSGGLVYARTERYTRRGCILFPAHQMLSGAY